MNLNTPQFLQKEQHLRLEVVELIDDVLTLLRPDSWVVIVVQIKCHPRERPFQHLRSLLPLGRDHPHPRVTAAMLEAKGKGTRLDPDLPSHFEHGLEPDTFLADIALSAQFGALTHIADSSEIQLCETVLVTFDDDLAVIDTKCNVWVLPSGVYLLKLIVISVLEKLEDEAYIF